jgi:signal transduction histidine kinase
LYTPLASLNLVLETLAPTVATARPLDGEVLRKSVDLARRQGGRLSRLISELLDVSRLDTGRLPLDLTRVDLTGLVSEVLERFAPDLTRARCQATLVGDASVVGRWDRSRLDQVIANLLSNAIKFGLGKPILVDVSCDQGRASLRIADQGIGVAPEEQPRIFDRWRRGVSSAHYGGLGLGLYICRGLVEAHAGTITVDSDPGRGTAFTVQLPCAGPPK